jgi:hypothetical protein
MKIAGSSGRPAAAGADAIFRAPLEDNNSESDREVARIRVGRIQWGESGSRARPELITSRYIESRAVSDI